MNTKREYKITSKNKQQRTITISCYEKGKLISKYRSYTLPKSEWNYYSEYATDGDIKNFLKSDDYYVIK